ncbi:MAG: DUF362 domain-containing protein [Candidatus Hermodarchaeota archaeon]
MKENSKVNSTDVAIIKSLTQHQLLRTGIEKLGGISSLIEEGDQIFIKININAPYGYPVNSDFESLRDLIELCKDAGAKQIHIGCFPNTGIKFEVIANILGFQSYIETNGAKLVFLEDQNRYPRIDIEIENKIIQIPEVILNSDKLIIYNQLSVDPVFKITLSLLNAYSMVPKKYQTVEKVIRSGKDYLFLDQYKQDLISNILDIYSIKKPDLVINDLFYFLEAAGPYVYKDSNLLFTGLGVFGRDAVAVDLITLKLVGVDLMKSDLLLEVRNRKLGVTDISSITIIGEDLDNVKISAKLSTDRLDDITIKNTIIKAGRICSGCYKEAYHLLNYIKTHMTKDLKYVKKQHFLTGENPPEPESLENTIIFGDCAINSSKNREFRKIRTSRTKDYVESVKEKIKKDYKSQKPPKVKEKINKNIIEIPGCPPNLYKSINTVQKYYGKAQTPNLSFYNNLIKTYYEISSKTKGNTGNKQ